MMLDKTHVNMIDWLIDHLTLADCNNPARGQKQGDIRSKDETYVGLVCVFLW